MMKTPSYCLVLLVLFFCGLQSSNAQNCPNESFNFFDQNYLDQFLLDYPDCEVINGSVTINGYINNLHALSNIRVIKGDLNIEYNSVLEDLSGLQNLDSVYGNVVINLNINLASVDALLDIKYISGMFSLSSNELLTDIDTFLYLDTLNFLSIVNTSLSTLSAFSQVRYVQRLSLTENTLITNLNGLSTLQFVQQIQIHDNSQLMLCNNPFICESLQNPGVIYYIENNAAGCENYFDILEACNEHCPAGFFFTSQSELDQFVFPTATCDQIRGSIYIHDASNTPIKDLGPLSGISHIDSSLVMIGNPEITSLSVFQNLIYIGGNLNISHNYMLSNLNGLQNVQRVGGDCIISSCFELTNLEGLNGITYVGRDLSISGNSLENLIGLNNIDTINRHLLIINEALMQSLQGFNKLQSINGYVSLHSNDGLQSLDGISKLSNIGGLQIGYNYKLLEMDALSGITSIPGDIIIYANKELLRMPPLPSVDSLGRNLQVYGNYKVTNMEGFNSFQSIGGSVEIRDMPGLTTLDGLNNLELIDGYLYLSKTGLLNLDALANLKTVNGSMTIRDNNYLANISGLNQVDPSTVSTPASIDLWISGNELLEVCSYTSICGILQNSENMVVIEGNGDGCDSEEEVRAECIVAVHDTDADARIQVYPNPSFGAVNIDAGELADKIESVEIFNLTGTSLHKGSFRNSFSFESFSEGSYIMIFRTKDQQTFMKLVVLMKG